MEYDVAIDGYLAEFCAEAIDAQQLSALKVKVIKLRTQHTDVLQVKLAYYWNNFNATEPVVPVGCLASDAMLHGTRTHDDANALWAKIQAVTAQKPSYMSSAESASSSRA